MVRRTRQRPPRIYTDKRGYYFIINKKKKYIKLDNDKKVTSQELLNIILKKYLLKKKRRRTKTVKKTIPYARGFVSGSVFGDLVKPRDVILDDVNLLNRRVQKLKEIKQLPENTKPLLILPPKPPQAQPLPAPPLPVKPKKKNSTVNLNALSTFIKNSKKTTPIKRDLEILYNKIPKKQRPKKGSKSVIKLFDILRKYYGDDTLDLQIRGLPFYNTMVSPEPDEPEEKEEKEEKDEKEEKEEKLSNPYNVFLEETEQEIQKEQYVVPPADLPELELEQEASGIMKGGLKTGEVNSLMSKYKKYLGCFPLDFCKFLPKTIPNTFGMIINTDPSSKDGKHWVALYKSNDAIEYYDSFGKEPSKEFLKELNNLIKIIKPSVYLKFKINKIVDQASNSRNCGYLSASFLIRRFKNIPFRECSGYDNTHNESDLIKKFDYI